MDGIIDNLDTKMCFFTNNIMIRTYLFTLLKQKTFTARRLNLTKNKEIKTQH